ncbi:hypothetical protein J2TS4_44440 [Paenibacillus sp. J2TS4]|nr:hypothetical protein J2TS4_44440 [Paenibacillus sp. J2TS4]
MESILASAFGFGWITGDSGNSGHSGEFVSFRVGTEVSGNRYAMMAIHNFYWMNDRDDLWMKKISDYSRSRSYNWAGWWT